MFSSSIRNSTRSNTLPQRHVLHISAYGHDESDEWHKLKHGGFNEIKNLQSRCSFLRYLCSALFLMYILLLKDVLEDVFKAAIVGLEDRVLGAHV